MSSPKRWVPRACLGLINATLLLGITGCGCGTGVSAAAAALAVPTRADAPPKVRVARIILEPQSLEAATPRPDQDDVLRRLTDEAARQAERSLVRHHLAETAETMEGKGPTLTGVVRLPVVLPRDVYGLNAASRKGSLATATLRISGADGTILKEGTASIDWDDVRWLRGARRRRNRTPDEVLSDAVRKVVDRAVTRLKRPAGTR